MDKTNSYIESISVNLFNGVFNSEIKFKNGLNLISGENGTGKTQLIKQLKSSEDRKFFSDILTNRIVVFNPLRNAEKKTQEEIVQKLRSQDMSIKKINEALKGYAINDSELTHYNSFGEVFVLAYEDLIDSRRISKEKAIQKTSEEFNKILKQVFPQYEIIGEWRDKKLHLEVKKQEGFMIPIQSLSRGESEVFALLFNIYANRNDEDIFLIDEPELHLNWDLERGLFKFLNWFCKKFKKQIIAATHSRVVFEPEFIPKTQFLVWENGQIVVKNKPTDSIKEKIGGDALQLVTALDINKVVFYVEDKTQKQVVEFLGDYFSKDLAVFKVDGRSNVQNLCRYLTNEGYKNAYFLLDGDNQGIPKEFVGNNQYTQLHKYCIENYFLDYSILASISGKTEKNVKKIVRKIIKNGQEDSHTKVFKKLAEIADIANEILDTYDASKIIGQLAKSLGLKSDKDLVEKFLKKCKAENKIDEKLSEIAEKIKKL